MNECLPFSEPLRAFVDATPWTVAKTYAKTWPHEYLVRHHVDQELFFKFVRHIRENGYQGAFYSKPITHFDEDGKVYWTMGAPIEETTIINRCRQDQSYAYRLDRVTLPESENPLFNPLNKRETP